MAVNLGRGGVVNTQPDSSQLLSTGAIFRQQADSNTKAQAGLMMQELKEEADKRGWSVKRMAEMYPNQFKAASAALMGGGTRGLNGADKMWAETIGGMESEEQRMQYAKDLQFNQDNPEGTPYMEWESGFNTEVQQLAGEGAKPGETTAPAPERTAADTDETYAQKVFDAQLLAVYNKDPDDVWMNSMLKAAEEQMQFADPIVKKRFEEAHAAMQDGKHTSASRGALLRLYQSVEDGSAEWTTKEGQEGNTQIPEGATRENAPGDIMEELQYMSENVPGMPQGNESAQLLKEFPNMEPALQREMIDYLQLSRREFNDKYGNRKQQEFWRKVQSAGHDLETNMLPTALGKPDSRQINETPAVPGIAAPPTVDFTAEAPERNEETETPQNQTRTPERRLGGMVGYEQRRDAILEEEASPANARVQQITAGRDALAEVARKEATAKLLGAQEASTYGNLELAYAQAASGSNIAGLEGRFDKQIIDVATTAQEEYFLALADAKVDAPPATAYTAEGFGAWFDKMSVGQQNDYVRAARAFTHMIGNNPALASQWEPITVNYGIGDRKSATLPRPTFSQQGGGTPTGQAQLIAALAALGISAP